MNYIKKLIILLMPLVLNTNLLAQETKFNTILKYQYSFQQDSLDTNSKEVEEMLLLINKEKSYFISNSKFTLDTLKNNNMNINELLVLKNNIPKNRIKFEIEKNKEINSINYYETIFINTYLDKNFKQKLKWEISNEKKDVSGYSCIKATTHFAGRDYIAWFTNEIPLNDGPYKFQGLPGLIVEIYDIKNHHHFVLTSLKNNNLSYNIKHRNIIETNMQEITKVRNNQINNIKNSGFDISPELMKKAKDKLAKINNPIEINIH